MCQHLVQRQSVTRNDHPTCHSRLRSIKYALALVSNVSSNRHLNVNTSDFDVDTLSTGSDTTPRLPGQREIDMNNPDTLTGRFVDKVRAIDFASLPSAAIEVARHVVLDTFAVALAGKNETQGIGRITSEYVRSLGGAPQASVIAGGFKTSMHEAAYANGTLAHALEYDAAWHPPNHPASPTIPAIFAIAEHHRLSGARVVEALVAAFEVQARVRLAATGMPAGEGFHKLGTTGLFGAVTAAARLLDLDRRQTLMAFGIAGGRAFSLAINIGTMTKSTYAGHAARMGIESAMLAKLGWTATDDVFGPRGFFDAFMPGDYDLGMLLDGFASPLRMVSPGVALKAYPSVYYTHRAIDAALELRSEFSVDPRGIERVEVRFPRIDYVDRPQPQTGIDGKYSVQYTTAAALLDGEVTPHTFTDARLHATDMGALLPRVSAVIDDAIPADLARMFVITEVWLKDGHRFTRRVDKLSGWPGERGLTREQQLRKFMAGARGLMRVEDAQRVIELVDRLETLPDVVEIMDILRCSDASAQATG